MIKIVFDNIYYTVNYSSLNIILIYNIRYLQTFYTIKLLVHYLWKIHLRFAYMYPAWAPNILDERIGFKLLNYKNTYKTSRPQ